MTAALLEKLKEIHARMTPGQWRASDSSAAKWSVVKWIDMGIAPAVILSNASCADADAIAELRNLLPALIAEQPAEPWRDIATAPKDGTWVLIYNALQNIDVGRWANTIHNGGDKWRNGDLKVIALPTHWLPIPPAPITLTDERAAQ